MMKKLLLIAAGILLTVSSNAQTVKISNNRIFEKEGKVFLSFTAEVYKLKSNEKMTITPVIYNDKKLKELKPIVLVGRNKAISEKRVGRTENIRYRSANTIPYTLTLPYEDWMSEVSLRINTQSESCCRKSGIKSQDIIISKLIHYDALFEPIKPIVANLSPIEQFDTEAPFLYPMEEYTAVKEDFDVLRADGALIIHFKAGSNSIDPNFKDNAQSLTQINRVLSLIENDPQAALGKIVLAGGSSPEGSVQRNQALAQQRVQSLQSYLGRRYASQADLFDVITIGEDWVGLRKMVESSNMPYKQEVLEILNTVSINNGREKQLKDLDRGRPYKYMKEYFFPSLRSAGYIRIFYESTPTPDMIATNKAIEQYNKQKYKNAMMCLDGITPTATTEEIRGVCHMMLREYDKAEVLLNNAVKLGSTRAVGYLEQLTNLRNIEVY